MAKRPHVWVLLSSQNERRLLEVLADREEVSVPQYVRECVNACLKEEGAPLLLDLRRDCRRKGTTERIRRTR